MKNAAKPLDLGVNIDHIAVLREARKINDPDPLMALAICAQNGANQITIHLREDRRHIQDEDVRRILKSSPLPVNLECSINRDIINIVTDLQPHRVTLVPEKREEVTTEGGLDVVKYEDDISYVIEQLHDAIIPVSLFIDPEDTMIEMSKNVNAEMVEFHTGLYANLFAMLNTSLPYSHHAIKELTLPRHELSSRLESAFETLKQSAIKADGLGLQVAAGHGLNYQNVSKIVEIPEICELNIGQSIIARSIFSGLGDAVKEMKQLCHR